MYNHFVNNITRLTWFVSWIMAARMAHNRQNWWAVLLACSVSAIRFLFIDGMNGLTDFCNSREVKYSLRNYSVNQIGCGLNLSCLTRIGFCSLTQVLSVASLSQNCHLPVLFRWSQRLPAGRHLGTYKYNWLTFGLYLKFCLWHPYHKTGTFQFLKEVKRLPAGCHLETCKHDS